MWVDKYDNLLWMGENHKKMANPYKFWVHLRIKCVGMLFSCLFVWINIVVVWKIWKIIISIMSISDAAILHVCLLRSSNEYFKTNTLTWIFRGTFYDPGVNLSGDFLLLKNTFYFIWSYTSRFQSYALVYAVL